MKTSRKRSEAPKQSGPKAKRTKTYHGKSVHLHKLVTDLDLERVEYTKNGGWRALITGFYFGNVQTIATGKNSYDALANQLEWFEKRTKERIRKRDPEAKLCTDAHLLQEDQEGVWVSLYHPPSVSSSGCAVTFRNTHDPPVITKVGEGNIAQMELKPTIHHDETTHLITPSLVPVWTSQFEDDSSDSESE